MIDHASQNALGRLVLVVDDDARVRQYMKTILESVGIEVVEATEGLEALVLFHRYMARIGLVVTDIRMPGMTGISLAGSLRSICPGLPVLFISGEASEPGMNELDQGLLFIEKPFTSKSLLYAVRQLFEWSVQVL